VAVVLMASVGDLVSSFRFAVLCVCLLSTIDFLYASLVAGLY